VPKVNYIDCILTGNAARNGDIWPVYYGQQKTQAVLPKHDEHKDYFEINIAIEDRNAETGAIEDVISSIGGPYDPYTYCNEDHNPRSFIEGFHFERHDIVCLQLTDMSSDAQIAGSIGGRGFRFMLNSVMWPQTWNGHDWPTGCNLFFKVDKREATHVQLMPPYSGEYRLQVRLISLQICYFFSMGARGVGDVSRAYKRIAFVLVSQLVRQLPAPELPPMKGLFNMLI